MARDSVLLTFHEREREPFEAIALKDIETKLDVVFDAMPGGFVVIDEHGLIGFFSSGAERLFGYRRSEALDRNVAMLMPSPYREAHDGYLAAYRETGVKKIIGIGREVIGRRKDGATFPMYLSIGEMWLAGRRYFVGVAHDLTSLKQAEERLLILSAAVDQSPSAILIASMNGEIEYVNQFFTRLTGYARDELVGETPRVLHSSHTAPEQYQRLWETLRDGREWRGEIQNRKKNGELYWALETITPLRDAKGDVTRYLAIQQDITEQKRAKEALAESEERFRQVAEMAGEWLWEQDPQGRYTYSSAAVRNILGFAPEDILGKTYLDLLTAEDQEHWTTAAPFASAGSQKPFHHLVNQYRHKDGHKVYTESTGAPIFDERGKLLKWRGVDHDITARKAFEDALRVRNRAIEAAHIGIVITDAQAQGNPNIYVNPALSRITGYSQEELLGQNMRLLQGPDTDPAALDQIRRAMENGESCEIVLKNHRKDGAPFWNELVISPVYDKAGKLSNYIGLQTDVTERRRAEESRHELEIAKNIQLSLLPSAPMNLPSLELAGVCAPASHVGGDYFDFFAMANAIDVVIADVSGRKNVAMLMPSPYREAHDGYLAAYRETGVKKIIGIGREVIGRRKDGVTFPMYLSIGEIELEGRRYFVGVAHDLTSLKQAEERLLTLSAALDQSPSAMLIASMDGQIEYVNQFFTRLTGYARDELVGESPRILHSNHTAPEQYRRLWETLRDGREWRGEIQNRKKNGEFYWAQETITPLRDAKGEVTRYLAIQQDVTEQKRAKEALAESEERFRQVADMTGEWLWEQDPQGCYIYSSGAVRGYPRLRARGNPWQDLPRSVDGGRSGTLDDRGALRLGRQPSALPSPRQSIPP